MAEVSKWIEESNTKGKPATDEPPKNFRKTGGKALIVTWDINWFQADKWSLRVFEIESKQLKQEPGILKIPVIWSGLDFVSYLEKPVRSWAKREIIVTETNLGRRKDWGRKFGNGNWRKYHRRIRQRSIKGTEKELGMHLKVLEKVPIGCFSSSLPSTS